MSYRPTDGISNKLDEDFTLPEKPEDSFKAIRDEVVSIKENVNKKTYGLFTTTELLNNERFFGDDNQSTRSVFRKVIDFGVLPNAGSKTSAHGLTIDANTHFVHIYGTATDPSTAYIPIPYSSPTLNQNILLSVDGTNVTITTAIDYSGYTKCYVVLEYLKN